MRINDIITEAFTAPYPMTWQHGQDGVDSLVRAVDQLYGNGQADQHEFDLGNVANIMQRANGQLVIVDPLSDFMSESLEENTINLSLDEYRTFSKLNSQGPLKLGDLYKNDMKRVATPISNKFEVRYSRVGGHHEYYLYSLESGKCVGNFTIETNVDLVDEPVTRPGVSIVTPHMVLADELQGQGVGSLIYSTFLQGGPWVFATGKHSALAKKLWDRLSSGKFISIYYDWNKNTVLDAPSKNSIRLLGPRDRFDLPKATSGVAENFKDGKNPGRRGLAKRMGVDCSQSISKLRDIASNSSGERQRMAHWCANMKSGKQK